MSRSLVLTLTLAVSTTYLQATAVGAQTPPPQILHYADIVLFNGKVLTADDQFTVQQAVAIRDDRLLHVGTTQEVLAMAGPNTRRIDLRGRSVVPGLIDTHLHQAWVGQVAKGEGASTSARRGRVQFKDVASGVAEVKRIVAGAQPNEWIYVTGPDTKPLLKDFTLAQLDAITPANPFVITTTNNLAVVNSIALKTLDLDIGGVEKDGAGKPTGIVSGFALGELTYERMPIAPVSEAGMKLQEEVLKKLNSQGLTMVMGRAQGTSVSVLKELWAQQRLTARVRIAHEFIRQNAHAEQYLKRLGNLSGFGDAWMKIIGTTIQPADGTSGSGAMWTKTPSRRQLAESPFGPTGQNKFQNYGNTLETSEYYNIILANRYGWNVLSVHSQGDGASDMLLQAYEQASKERPLQGVWAFDHALSRTPENIDRAAKLGVIFSVAPKYLFMNTPESLLYQYGEDVHRMTPVRDMITAGMKPVGEADITGKYSSPLWGMGALITRTDEKGRMWGGNQKITRQEALWMKTSWAARYSGDEKALGTLTAGKLADVVVLSDDFMTVPEDRIANVRADYTIVGGKVVYDREKEGEITSEYWDRARTSDEG